MSGGQALETTWEGTWSIADEGIAVIRPMDDGRMLVEGISPGTTALTHSFGGTTVEVSLEVTTAELVSLEIWPQNPQMPLGTSQAFYTIGTYTDNTRAGLTAVSVWTSTDPSIAFVGNTPERICLGIGRGNSGNSGHNWKYLCFYDGRSLTPKS